MAPQIVACTDAVIVTGWGSAQGEAVECLGDPAIRFPDTQSCLDESLPAAGQLGVQGQGWPSDFPKLAGGDTVSLTHSLMEGKRKYALKMDSKLQVVWAEGSVPVISDICQREDPSVPPLSGSHRFTAHQVLEWGQPGGHWQWQLEKHSLPSPFIKKQKQKHLLLPNAGTWLSLRTLAGARGFSCHRQDLLWGLAVLGSAVAPESFVQSEVNKGEGVAPMWSQPAFGLGSADQTSVVRDRWLRGLSCGVTTRWPPMETPSGQARCGVPEENHCWAFTCRSDQSGG